MVLLVIAASEEAAPSGAHGVRLHCSRESAGWASHTAIFDVHHGRIHVGHTLVFIYLEDIAAGEGGLLVPTPGNVYAIQNLPLFVGPCTTCMFSRSR